MLLARVCQHGCSVFVPELDELVKDELVDHLVGWRRHVPTMWLSNLWARGLAMRSSALTCTRGVAVAAMLPRSSSTQVHTSAARHRQRHSSRHSRGCSREYSNGRS